MNTLITILAAYSIVVSLAYLRRWGCGIDTCVRLVDECDYLRMANVELHREVQGLRKALGHHQPRTGRVLMEHYGHLYEYTWKIENDGEVLRVIVTDFEEGVLTREGAESLCRAVHWIRERAMEEVSDE